MKFLTFAEMRQRVWTDAAIAGICAGTIGAIFDYAFPTWPLFTTVGVSGGVSIVIMLGYVYIRVEQMRAEEAGASIKQSLEDTQPATTPDGYRPIQRNTYTVSVQDGNTLKLADLSACYEFHHPGDKNKYVNGLVAAEAFMDHIKRGGQISNRRCEAMCGGRDSYVAMRDKCVRLGLIVKTANGYHPANVRNN